MLCMHEFLLRHLLVSTCNLESDFTGKHNISSKQSVILRSSCYSAPAIHCRSGPGHDESQYCLRHLGRTANVQGYGRLLCFTAVFDEHLKQVDKPTTRYSLLALLYACIATFGHCRHLPYRYPRRSLSLAACYTSTKTPNEYGQLVHLPFSSR